MPVFLACVPFLLCCHLCRETSFNAPLSLKSPLFLPSGLFSFVLILSSCAFTMLFPSLLTAKPGIAEYNLDLFTEQLDELLSALDIEEPVSLIGLSFGGPVVTAFANQYPDHVLSVILMDPQVSSVLAADIFPMNIPGVGEIIMGVYIVPIMLPETQASDFYQPENFPNWEHKYRDQMQYRGFRRALLSSTREMIADDPIAEYGTLGKGGFPVVLFWGREDQTITSADIAVLRKALPNLEFHAIDKAGHLPHYERPEVVNPLLIEFLQNVESETLSDEMDDAHEGSVTDKHCPI